MPNNLNMMSMFQPKKEETPEAQTPSNPISFQPFQRYIGKDEINKRAQQGLVGGLGATPSTQQVQSQTVAQPTNKPPIQSSPVQPPVQLPQSQNSRPSLIGEMQPIS